MSFQEYSESLKGRLRLGGVNAKAMAGALALLLVAAAVVAFNVVGAAAQEPLVVHNADDAKDDANADAAPASVPLVCVHVAGCVASPGIVYLEEGSRVADAVAAAGGMTPDAAADGMNLARVVVDGEQVMVQSAADIALAAQSAAQASASSSEAASKASGAAPSGKVNINTANVAELQTLSGIGQSKAQKIVDHRDAAGPFGSVDALLDVSGIGEKTLEAIRDRICV